MTTRPLVSISMPTFNRAGSFMPISLASARAQTYENLEIFISDNASADHTRELIEGLGDPRIRYHRQAENIGPSANMNFCIQQARGKYVIVLPDDDLLDADFVERALELALKKPEAALIRTGTRVVDEHGTLIREYPNEADGLDFDDFVLAWIDARAVPYLCSTMFRTKELQELGMYSKHFLFNDLVSEFKLAAKYGRADMREVKGSYRLHSGELTFGATIEAWCEESQDLLKLICELSPRKSALIRAQARPFLAGMMYRRALHLRKPKWERGLALLTVLRTHGLPPSAFVTGGIRRRTREALDSVLGHAR